MLIISIVYSKSKKDLKAFSDLDIFSSLLVRIKKCLKNMIMYKET